MVLCGIEDCNQDANNAFSVGSVRSTLVGIESEGATGQKGACKVADGCYDGGEIVAAVPEAIVTCLVAEDLDNVS